MKHVVGMAGGLAGFLLLAATAVAQAPAAPPAPAAAAAAPAVDEAAMAALMTQGASVYRTDCSVCHGNAGEGGAGQMLAGYSILATTKTVVNQIIFGGAYMPPFGTMSNGDIAAVSTYIRSSFGNSFGAVTEAEVAALR